MPKNEYGKYAFLAAVVVSILSAFWPSLLLGMGALLLFALGLVVGYLNIEKGESVIGILILIAFPLIAVGLNAVPQLSIAIGPILQNLAVMTGGAAIIVVGKAFWEHYGN